MKDFNSSDGLIHRKGKLFDPADGMKEVKPDNSEDIQIRDEGLTLSGDGVLIDTSLKGPVKEVNYSDIQNLQEL